MPENDKFSIEIGGRWLDDLGRDLEASDRSFAILAGAVLDDQLKGLLPKLFRPHTGSEADKLFEDNRIISSFSSRIELAYRTSLIPANIRDALLSVKKIRNDAAHKQDFSFDMAEAISHVKNLERYLRVWEQHHVLLPLTAQVSRKDIFYTSVVILHVALEFALRHSEQIAPIPDIFSVPLVFSPEAVKQSRRLHNIKS